MKRLTWLAYGTILLTAACGKSESASDDGGGGHGGAVDGGAGGGSGTGGAAAASGSGGAAGGAACAGATTLAACTALADCHAVFTSEPRTPIGSCTCPDTGCCTHFSSCASGGHATCAGPVLCKVATPYCEPGYAVETNGTCYVGCVISSVCQP